MCVRIYLVENDNLVKNFNLAKLDDIVEFRLKYLDQVGSNLSPEQTQLIIYEDIDVKVNRMEVAKWGLVPSFSKSIDTGFNMNNTRIESIVEKPYFKRLLHNNRCLIPINGYYEWNGEKGSKQPHAIQAVNSKMLYLAGLYDIWMPANGDEILSFSIITKQADDVLSSIHPRMPIIMNLETAQEWIKSGQDKKLLDEKIVVLSQSTDFVSEQMKLNISTIEVDKSLNNPSNEKFRIQEFLNEFLTKNN